MPRPGEVGAVRKHRGASLPVALVFPNEYSIGMANLGLQYLYQVLNSVPGLSAERFFYQPGSSGPLLSEEWGRPISDFRVIAFSIPFENDYPAVPAVLEAARIPPLEKDRTAADPFVMAGGVAVSLNPEPLADFLDLVFIGELLESDRERLIELFSLVAEGLRASAAESVSRREQLREFAGLPSVYVPSAYTFTFRADGGVEEVLPDPGFPRRIAASKRRAGQTPVPVSVLFSPDTEFGESLLVELNRGCSRGCRFCAAGWIHRPPRYAPFDSVRGDMERALAEGRSIGLIGSDLARHPQIEEILEFIVDRGGRFSLSSMRPEGLTDKMIRLLAKVGQKTATLAPEVASRRLKKVVGKDIPPERFYELVAKLVSAGIPNVRFYFMIGLPTETDEDADAIVEFVLECRRIFIEASRPTGRVGRIGIQVNPFVPKPWTPFQWAAMPTPRELERRSRILRKGLKSQPNVVLRIESPRLAQFQAVLSRGDRRIAAVILRAAKDNGRWSAALKGEGIDPHLYAHRERPADEIFPWDHMDHGIDKQKLLRIFLKAMGRSSSSVFSP